MKKVESPEQELRFTRSGQAIGFWIAAAMMVTAAAVWIPMTFGRDLHPDLPHPAWALLPLGGAAVLARLAARLTRHAYVILTPLGIEIFPFFRPAAGMRLVTWQEVAVIEHDDARSLLTLHHNPAKTAGIHLSLKPIRTDRRRLLIQAVSARINGRSEDKC